MAKVWKKIQRADSDFAGNVTGTFGSKGLSDFYRTDNKPTKSDVGLGNVDNTKFSGGKFIGEVAKSDGTTVFDPSDGNFTGKIAGSTASDVKSKAEDAKDAIDGNKSITMVGGSLSIGTPSSGVYPFSVDSSGNLRISGDEFQALADGTVTCKGSYTVNQDDSSNSRITLAGSSSGTAEMEIAGANPVLELGSPTPLGASTLNIRRSGTTNQSRVLFWTGTGTGSVKGGMGFANQPSAYNDQMWIHIGNGYDNSAPYKERCFSFDADGKMGMYANTKSVAGFTFGSDGTNKHVYIKDGGLSVGTTTVSDHNITMAVGQQVQWGGTTNAIFGHNTSNYVKIKTNGSDRLTINSSGNATFNNNVDISGDLQVSTDATFEGDLQVDGSTTGISYSDLSSKPTIPAANTLSYSTSTIDGNGYIWVMPTQFMPNDDNSYFNAAIVDNGAQARVMTSSLELYANVPIPTGYKVTKVRLNGTASVQIGIYYSDVTTSTATSAQVTTLYTNADNAVNPSSGIAATSDGRYMILRWQPTSTSHRLYGARLTITKV